MLYEFAVEKPFLVCPVARAAEHLDLAQRRTHPWVIQGDSLPTYGRKDLRAFADIYPGYVRIWRMRHDGVKFSGFLLLKAKEWSRFMARYGKDHRKQLLVRDDHFTLYYLPNGKTRLVCDIVGGYVMAYRDLEGNFLGNLHSPVYIQEDGRGYINGHCHPDLERIQQAMDALCIGL